MKKTYTLIGSILVSGLMFGQSVMQTAKISMPVKNFVIAHPQNSHPSGGITGGTREEIWSNDFSDAADWIITADSGTTDEWVIGTTPPSFGATIASPTASNGYAMFDSNLLGSEAEAGVVPQVSSVVTASAVDCGTFSTVQIRFSQMYTSYLDDSFVLVSTDGVTWSKFEVNANIAENSDTPNPDEIVVDITSIAANQSTVYIGFQFVSTSDQGGQFGWAYVWSVDDVVLETSPDYELALGTIFNADYFPSSFDLTVTSGPYYSIPVAQTTPISIWTVAKNLGSNTANNVTVELSLDFNGTSVGTWTSGVLSLEPGDADSILIVTEYTPTEVGTVDATLNLIYEENTELSTANNTGATKIEITENVYALDEDGDMQFGGFSNSVPFAEWKLVNLYEIQSETNCTGVSFALTANPGLEDGIVGGTIFINILELTEEGDLVPLLTDGDNLFDIETDDLSGLSVVLLTYNFETPVLLEAGKTYGAQIGFNLVDNPIFFAYSGSSSFDFNLQFQGENLFLGDNYLLRLNTQDEIGIKENSQNGNLILSQNQPNPVRENTVISYELKNAENVRLEIYDITGKLISTINEGNKAAGSYTINYNASQLNAGIYTYTLIAGDARLTKKMTVIK